MLTHSHTKSANNVCMAGSGDVVLGATLMLGVTGTECEIGNGLSGSVNNETTEFSA